MGAEGGACGVNFYAKQLAKMLGTCWERGERSVWHCGNQSVLSSEKDRKY